MHRSVSYGDVMDMREKIRGIVLGIHVPLLLAVLIFLPSALHAQQDTTGTQPEQLRPVEINPPALDRRQAAGDASQAPGGFGSNESIPAGQPFSDYRLTPGESVTAMGRTANLASTPYAVSIIDNRGTSSLGQTGLSDMLQGRPGTWSSGFAGNPFDAPIVVRGFSNESTNRVSLLLEGVNLNIPRQEANTNFIFPELIERVELIRGGATVPLGDKALGGAVNVIMKKPRQNPGLFFGAEGGSWGTDREWAALNLVRDSVAAGIFLGRYSQEGWRIYYGNNEYEEPFTRPGPWALYNVQGSVNWKITPRVTLDISQLISSQRLANYNAIAKDRWDRRDIRSIENDVYGYRPYDDFPEERFDMMTIGKLYYEGGQLGRLDITATNRRYDRSIRTLFTSTVASDQRWTDVQLQVKYARTDSYGFLKNDLVLGNEHSDGRFRRVARAYQTQGWISGLEFNNAQNGGRHTLSYYVMNQTTFWDRLIVGFGYRVEHYDLPDIYSKSSPTNAPVRGRLDFKKSSTEYSIGLIYDRELGSSMYYKHSLPYRFPNFDDMINLLYPFPFASPEPIWLLDPEDGTQNEFGIRHWFTRNAFVGLTYYQLDMNNEIYYGPDPAYFGMYSRNLNVPLVSHSGVELEGLVRFTPRWTLKGNYTKQKVIFRTNWQPNDWFGRTTEDKWLTLNPAEMGNLSLGYDNKEWGFSAMISYHYIGSRYMLNDIFNLWPDLEPAKWGDIVFSQTFFDGQATLYFGVNNFSDAQYAMQGSIANWVPPTYGEAPVWWSAAGRTFYMGLRSSLDFHRMQLPSVQDLLRMNNRLYGAARNELGRLSGALRQFGSNINGAASF
jgi:iron complex outermembrane receptor protein